MSLRLNLGCGRAHLPTTPDNPFTAHQGYALDRLIPSAYAADAGWVNVDREDLPGVHEVVDLFCYPWVRQRNGNPWNDNSVDEIFCSHIVEHIPHGATLGPIAGKDLRHAAELDGWYAFFQEAWRILKPGGRIVIVAPYAWSGAGITDPTHHRMVMPESWSYFIPNPDAPFDYQIPARFVPEGDALLILSPFGAELADRLYVNILAGRNEAELTAEERSEIDRRVLTIARREVDAVIEFAYALTAVKDGA